MKILMASSNKSILINTALSFQIENLTQKHTIS